MQTRIFGRTGEDYAERLLKSLGYIIIQKNFSCKFGEIDIICLKDSSLIFVEVKLRSGNKYGKPEEAVTPYKIRKIARVGEYYSLLHPNTPKKLKIVVVALETRGGELISQKIINAT